MISIAILFLLIVSSLSEDKLVFLMTHIRHGARAPQKYYDQSKYLDYVLESWNNPGELTPIGQRMHYALGLQNREEYITKKKFLSENFDPHEILIYSTKFNRTLLSVSSFFQGLYPPGTGGEITEEQKNNSKPQVNLSPEVEKELEKLENNSLPEKMSVFPIRMINDNERKIIIYDIPECLWKRDEMRKINLEKSEDLKKFIEEFKKKYKDDIFKIYETKPEYNIDFIDNFCDAFISGSTELKEMKKLNDTGINKNELLDQCFEFMKLNFRDWISGDSERILPTLEVSKLMREFIHYMNQRIDADIKGEDTSKNYEDYSKPKMLMISGHDSTISMWEMFLIKIFKNNNNTDYIYPKFASELTFEITVNSALTEKKRTDYKINCYLNNKSFINEMTVDEFINNITDKLYSDDKIDEICHFKSSDSLDIYFILTIVFSATTGILLILMVFFIIKACRSKNSETIVKEGRLLNNSETSF